jgi:hypothetical protein
MEASGSIFVANPLSLQSIAISAKVANIERGAAIAPTGLKRGSAKVEVAS